MLERLNLKTRYMTRNDCYTAGRKIVPRGIMVHSTATPGVMAASWFSRWNKSFKAGETNRQVCVHAFLDDKETWQYLPWDHRGWHAGGRANDTHIGFEICEPAGHTYSGSRMVGYDVKKNQAYFDAVWKRAVALTVYLCRMYGLTEKDVIGHSEGHQLGIASNHADVGHWFPKHGKSMDAFRAEVRAELQKSGYKDAEIEYVVKKGDTLTAIAVKFGTTVEAIAVLNGIKNVDLIREGQKLRIPATRVVHVVQKGETLTIIARRYGTTVKAIAELNEIKNVDLIYEGQELLIPVGGAEPVEDEPESEPEPELVTGEPIVGEAEATVWQARAWAEKRGAHQRFVDIADAYWKYGELTGIRPEVLYVQSARETNFGKFTGAVTPDQNNWAGIKTRNPSGDARDDHQTFDTPDDGVRAHFNHICAYVGKEPVGEPHPRYYVVMSLAWAGTIRFVEELGGKYAPNPKYGEELVSLYLKDLLKTEDPGPPPESEKPEESELYYRVVAGSFKNRNNAEVRVDELKKAGFDSFIMTFRK